MHRSVFLVLTCLLTVATGSALLYAAATVAIPALEAEPSSAPPDAANTALVRRFYAAANQTLRTGDPAALDGMVAADLVEHATGPGLPANRAGLVDYLVGLGTAFPAMRLTAVDVLAQGDEVMARVRVEGAERGAFLGIPLTGELAVWGPFDLFRIADGAIVEHWASREGAAWLRPLTRAPLSLLVTHGASIQVERVTYPPRSAITVRGVSQHRLVFVEIGSLRVEIDGVAVLERSLAETDRGEPVTVPQASTVELRPGDLLVLSGASTHVARNEGLVPAVSKEVTILPTRPLTPMTEGFGAATGSGGVSAQLLATASVPPSTEPAAVAVGQAVLASNASIPAHTAAGPEVVYVVDGVLGVGPVPPVGAERPEDVRQSLAPEARFGRGATALFAAGTVGPLRNAGDAPIHLVLLIVAPTPSVAR